MGECGIDYDPDRCAAFTKLCVRTDWESTVYLVNYGGFSGHLNIILVNSDANLLRCQFVGKGSFGSVWRCELEGAEACALKDIEINSKEQKSVDLALK